MQRPRSVSFPFVSACSHMLVDRPGSRRGSLRRRRGLYWYLSTRATPPADGKTRSSPSLSWHAHSLRLMFRCFPRAFASRFRNNHHRPLPSPSTMPSHMCTVPRHCRNSTPPSPQRCVSRLRAPGCVVREYEHGLLTFTPPPLRRPTRPTVAYSSHQCSNCLYDTPCRREYIGWA